MILALDTSTAACTAALFDSSGACLAARDELIGRGHAERLVPMIAELLGGRRAEQVLVGAGPGSFTGIRVAIAAAQGLAIGWNCPLAGLSSLALLAAGAKRETEDGSAGEIAAAIDGGHGELFAQQFDGSTGEATSELFNLPAERAAERISAPLVVGPAARKLVEARGNGEWREGWPSARNALRLCEPLRTLLPRPIYARAPDARARSAA